MVYRGKPSGSCSECRIKRRKCDLSRPSCRPCLRAGTRCDGYRDKGSLAFQNQTTETLHRVSVVPDDKEVLIMSYQSNNHNPWARIPVVPEEQALHFYFHHYAIHDASQNLAHPDCYGIIYKRATGSGYLANLINAIGLVSMMYMKNAPFLASAASGFFSRALFGIHASLADPKEAASDQMLVTVMLLALYETVTSSSTESPTSWDRHVDGALALVKLRGTSQFRNRIGRSIFLHFRTEILIDCLQRGLRVPNILMNSMAEAREYESLQEAPAARLADIIANACNIISSAQDNIPEKMNLEFYVSLLLLIDRELENWTEDLPPSYNYTTQTNLANPGGEEEAFMGRYDTYSTVDITTTWNLQRCTRIVLHQALIESLSGHSYIHPSPSDVSPLPISYGQMIDKSRAVLQESSTAICCSVSYIISAYDKSGEVRASSVRHLLWPLFVAGTAHNADDAMRDWIVSQMQRFQEATGIQKAKVIASTIQQRL